MRRREFSLRRFWAIVVKEFIQMRRDRLTFLMMLSMPLMQLILFGYAINSDPRHLPAGILLGDQGPQARTLLQAIRNSSYFTFVRQLATEQEGRDAIARGEIQFIINIPENFTRDLLRGDRPTLLIEADGTDPAAIGNAVSTSRLLLNTAMKHDFQGPLAYLAGGPDPIDLRIQTLYNPEGLTRYNIVPGLMGVVLTMTMIMITGLGITRERERGTMENLLAMPAHPAEVLIGKIIPYILLGYIQVALILGTAYGLFRIPMLGSLALLLGAALVFIVANLAVGITFSTLAKNQLQAVQMAYFFFLPSIMLSGFMFPFRGMPRWAQYLGEVLPLTHFLRIVRGILLKGNGPAEVWPQLWPIALFATLAVALGVKRYRQTLD
jgi:ABC-2 type transport system permease protein